MTKKLTSILLFTVISSFTVFLLFKSLSFYDYNLKKNRGWTSIKTEFELPLVAAHAATVSPQLFWGGKLNLDVWFGFQRLLSKVSIRPEEISFNVDLEDNAFFDFILDHTDDSWVGIRFSHHPDVDSIVYLADAEGKFVEKTPIQFGKSDLIKSYKIHMKIVNRDLLLKINRDEQKIFLPRILRERARIGFQGGQDPARIDNLWVKDGDYILQDKFENERSFNENRPIMLLTGFLVALFFLILNLFKRIDKKYFYFTHIINLNFFFISLGLFVWLYYINPNFYPPEHWKVSEPTKHNKSEQDYVNETIGRLKEESRPNRLLFIGGSQTIGVGASKVEKTFLFKLGQRLNEKFPNQYEVISLAVMGYNLGQLLDIYKSNRIFEQKVTHVFANVSVNDMNTDKQIFRQQLEELLKINQDHHITTILIPESNAIFEGEHPDIVAKHEIMFDLANKNKLPIVNLHDFLWKERNNGSLWWDKVHLSDYAQSFVADILFKFIVY